MIVSSAERNIRRVLPLIRLMQTHMPLRWSGWLNRWSLSRARMPAGVARQPISADGVPGEWLIPEGSPGDQALLYLHGGGFVYGQTLPHLEMGAYLAQKIGARVLMVGDSGDGQACTCITFIIGARARVSFSDLDATLAESLLNMQTHRDGVTGQYGRLRRKRARQ